MSALTPIKSWWYFFWLRISRTLWLPITAIVLGGFVIVTCVLPAYFADFLPSAQQNSNTYSNLIGQWVNKPDGAIMDPGANIDALVAHLTQGTHLPEKDFALDFFALDVAYIPANVNGLISNADFAVSFSAWGNGSTTNSQGSAIDRLLLPSFPNISKPTLQLGLNTLTPVYLEARATLPNTNKINVNVDVVKPATFYPFDRYNVTITATLLYANGPKGDPLQGPNDPKPYWCVFASQAGQLMSISGFISIDISEEFSLDTEELTQQVPVAFVVLTLSRTTLAKVLTVFIGILTWLLAASLMVLSIDVLFIRSREPAVPAIALGTTLLFALPNIRNALPGIPPIGIAYDVWVYLPAICLACASSLFMMAAFLGFTKSTRETRYRKPAPPAKPSKKGKEGGFDMVADDAVV